MFEGMAVEADRTERGYGMRKRILILAMCLGLTVSSISGCASAGKNQQGTAGKVSQKSEDEQQEKGDKKDEWIENPVPEEYKDEGGNMSLAEVEMEINTMEACEPLNLTAEQKLEDFDFFWKEVSDKVYCLDELAAKRGVNLEKHLAGYRERIKNSKDDYEFYDILKKSTVPFGRMWHITLSAPHNSLSIGIFHPEHPVVKNSILANDNQKRLKYWDRMLSQKDFNYKQNKNTKVMSVKMPELKIISDKIAVIELPTFSYPTKQKEKEAEKAMLEMMKQVSDYEHVIFDLKSNGGGSTYFGDNVLIASNIDEPLEFSISIFFKDTEQVRLSFENRGTEKNEYRSDYRTGIDFPITSIEKLPKEQRIEGGEYGNADSYAYEEAKILPRFQKKILQGKIWVLTYPENYSASERFVSTCKQTGFATLVGSQTAGDGMGLMQRYFALPNSGLIGTASATWGLNEDGTCNSNEGTRPDIESSEGETPLETCLKAIEEYENKK